jgi:NADH:ubiquinone oxidoreductase subunit K
MIKILVVSAFIFFVGVLGLFFTRRHIILLLLSIELIFLSVNYNFLIFSLYLDDILGQFFVLCIIAVAAAESVIGLAILVIFYRLRGGISLDLINLLKG